MAGDVEQSSHLDAAFTTSMLKKNNEALEKLQHAVDNGENFDIGKYLLNGCETLIRIASILLCLIQLWSYQIFNFFF